MTFPLATEKGAPWTVIVPKWVLRATVLEPIEKLYLVYLLDQFKRVPAKRKVRSDEHVAKRLGVSVRALREARAGLVAQGFVIVTPMPSTDTQREGKPGRGARGRHVVVEPTATSCRSLSANSDGPGGFARPPAHVFQARLRARDRLVLVHLWDRWALARDCGGGEHAAPGDLWEVLYCGLDDIATGVGIGRDAASSALRRLREAGMLSTRHRINRTTLIVLHGPAIDAEDGVRDQAEARALFDAFERCEAERRARAAA